MRQNGTMWLVSHHYRHALGGARRFRWSQPLGLLKPPNRELESELAQAGLELDDLRTL